MIRVTDAARDAIRKILEAQGEGPTCLRLAISGRGPSGFEYELTLVGRDEKQDDDVEVDAGGLTLFVAGDSVEHLDGATLDYVEQAGGMGFKIDNPNPLWTDPIAQRVQDVIDHDINPNVASHGGHVTLLEVRDRKAYIRLGGGCQGCGMASVTLKQGIEVAIKQAVPEIEDVLDTTDHASGTNPYYQPAKGGGGASPFAS